MVMLRTSHPARQLAPLVMSFLALCGACGEASPNGAEAPPSGDGGTYATVLEAPPYPPIQRLGPEPFERSLQDKRWFHADRVEERHLPLLRRIKRGEMGNFGGVEWRWTAGPENGGLGRLTGIVYFLRSPAETLARYTRDPLFRAAKGDFARTDQERVADEWSRRFEWPAVTPGYGNMTVPELRITIPRAEFEAQVRRNGWRLPVNLGLRFDPRAEPDLPAVAPDVAPLIRAFPHEPRLSGPKPDIATVDAVVLRDGCFFIDASGDADPLVEFPFGVGVYRDAEGHLAFRQRYAADKRRFGRVGTRLQLGHRSRPRPAPPELRQACGADAIVTVTSVDQAAGYGGRWFDVREYRDREGLSSAEAIRRANDCLLAQEAALANTRLRGGNIERVSCAHIPGLEGPINPAPPKLPPRQGDDRTRVPAARPGERDG